jgi:phytoene dehydrogenase-like protein
MQMIETAVIGSGIGGSLFSALHADEDMLLFEKDKNLGGCASTFKRFGNYYNAGATTFVGYEPGHVIYDMFEQIGFKPDIVKSSTAYQVIMPLNNRNENIIINRTSDKEAFLQSVQDVFPNPNNRQFWEKIIELDRAFWQLVHQEELYINTHSVKNTLQTLPTLLKLMQTFKSDTLSKAASFLNSTLGEISKEYRDFLNASLMITLQTDLDRSPDLPLISFALGLAYPFHDVYYAKGGMGTLIDQMLNPLKAQQKLKNKEEILNIYKDNNSYILQSTKEEYRTKNIILNSSVYDSQYLFQDKAIRSYYENFKLEDKSDQSAFVLYLTINSKKDFLDHYQIILQESVPNAISNSFFISFSQKNDQKLSRHAYSVTISTHTKASFWNNLSKENRDIYEQEKLKTQNYLLIQFLKVFQEISPEEIKTVFSATSITFKRYINRLNCGGKALEFNISTLKNIAQPATPFKGLYQLGDTLFTSQGWPGVAMGVKILESIMKKE